MISESACIFFVTRSLCFIINNVCPQYYFFDYVCVSNHGQIYRVAHMLYRFFQYCNYFSEMLEVSNAMTCPSGVSSERQARIAKQSISSIAPAQPRSFVLKRTVECTSIHPSSAVTFLLNEYIWSWSSGIFY